MPWHVLEDRGWGEAVSSGVLASLAAVFGKVGGYAVRGETGMMHWVFVLYGGGPRDAEVNPGIWPSVIVAMAFYGAMVLSNGAMLGLLLRAMDKMGSTNATILNVCVNYLVSGVFGRVLFRETLSERWCLGAMLMLAGSCLVASSCSTRRGICQSAKTPTEDIKKE